MNPVAGFVMFVLFVVMSLSLAVNVYYHDTLSGINERIFRATRLTAVDSLGLKVKETKSLVGSLIRERQELERENLALGQDLRLSNCKLAPYQKAMGVGGDLVEIIGSLNPVTIITRGPSIFSDAQEAINLAQRASNDCR